ncbi:MAG: UDP-2,3-diacylglucosamine diphosphatase [Deltaproteobacteria bacterium]|nr:UDP-2,3-diacylglucosamine diphosphatase [Candidatus Zymogenaceae bacterium]
MHVDYRKALFISDAHLKDPEDENYRAMLAFLDGELRKIDDGKGVDALFIVGDFFDVWINNYSIPKRYRPVMSRLEALYHRGVSIHFFEGNHDFFMGGLFKRLTGAVVYPEGAEVTLQGLRLFITHGDQINKKNIGTRLLRWILRSPVIWLVTFLAPAWPVELIGTIMGRLSRREHSEEMSQEYAASDHVIEFCREKEAEGYDGVVIGHYHAQVTASPDDGFPCLYINTGRWGWGKYHYTLLEEGEFTNYNFQS